VYSKGLTPTARISFNFFTRARRISANPDPPSVYSKGGEIPGFENTDFDYIESKMSKTINHSKQLFKNNLGMPFSHWSSLYPFLPQTLNPQDLYTTVLELGAR
jgi:hypothetical protein